MPTTPKRPPKSTRNWQTQFTAEDRQYDPARDGWDTHKVRRQPTLEDLLARKDEPAWDW